MYLQLHQTFPPFPPLFIPISPPSPSLRMFGGVWKVGHEITHQEIGVLSSVALFHSKSGILSGLRASLVL